MSTSEEIEKLNKLRADGALTEEEFTRAKAKLIDGGEASIASPGTSKPLDVNQWSMFIHLSQFAGFLVPFAGFIMPIVLWQIKKKESPIIDQHGKNVTNWLISALIYSAVSAVLIVILIGILLLPAIAIMGIVFAILGAIKANEGEVWQYPLSIRFFR